MDSPNAKVCNIDAGRIPLVDLAGTTLRYGGLHSSGVLFAAALHISAFLSDEFGHEALIKREIRDLTFELEVFFAQLTKLA